MRRTTRIQVYCHPDEKAVIEALAKEKGKSASSFLRTLPIKHIEALRLAKQEELPIKNE